MICKTSSMQVEVMLTSNSHTEKELMVKGKIRRVNAGGATTDTFMNVTGCLITQNRQAETPLLTLSSTVRLGTSSIYIKIEVIVNEINQRVKLQTTIKKERRDLQQNVSETIDQTTKTSWHM